MFSKNNLFRLFFKSFRTAKTFAPSLTDAKFAGQRVLRRIANIPHEKDFYALGFLHNIIDEDFLFVDVGANRGQSIDSVRIYSTICNIVSFEANTLLANNLQYVRKGDNKLKVYNYALSDTVGETILYIPQYRDYIFDGLASTCYEEAFGWLNSSKIFGFRPELLSIIEMKVPTTTFDTFNLQANFIKIDVQGTELSVLKGAEKTIKTCQPILLVELPTLEGEGQFLKDIGYLPYTYMNKKIAKGISNGGNSFFLSRKHLELFPKTMFID